jgi:Zn-dependent peptidase ImmA (M78 family)
MAMRRGFKTEANGIAIEVRAELDLRALDPLDPWRLAEHLEIPVITLSSLEADIPDAVHRLRAVEPDAFSAVTVFAGTKRAIVHNDRHSRGRQASNLAHEVAHGLLHHPATPARDDRGCRYWNQDIEDEASWLAGALLIPEDAALWIVRQGMSLENAADHFGVTKRMVTFRVNVTGARIRVARARRSRSA